MTQEGREQQVREAIALTFPPPICAWCNSCRSSSESRTADWGDKPCTYQLRKADQILSLLKELGYRKVPKLKVLSEPNIESIYMRRFQSMGETYQNLIQAQRDYDQKQIEETV